MSKKQPNMQRKVASLDLDADVLYDADDSAADELTPEESSELYEQAISYLKRGMKEKEIADRLVNAGLARPQAHQLAQQVWRENLGERRTNANILLGTGVFFVLLWGMFTGIGWLQSGTLTLASPTLLLLFVGGWWFYKAWDAYRKLQ